MPPTDTREIVGIQYLRAVAAVAVVLSHASGFAAQEKYFGVDFIDVFLHGGRRGVDLFFLVSGFIIAVASLRPASLEPSIGGAEFALRRFARVVPLMWLAIVVHCLVRFAATGNFALLPTLSAITLAPFGVVEPLQIWTLRHEVLFYLAFGLSFLVGQRRLSLLVVWLLAPLLLLIFPEAWSSHANAPDFFGVVLNPVNVEFGFGFLAAVFWLKITRDRSFVSPIHPVVVVSLAMLALMGLDGWLGRDFPDLLGRILFGALCLPILLFASHVDCPEGSLDRLGRLIGRTSYSLYLFNPVILLTVIAVWSAALPQTPVALVVLVTTIATTAVCTVIGLRIEEPLVRVSRRWLKSWLGPRAA